MEIRAIIDTDEDGIRTLFTQCFAKELSHDEWVWKYKTSSWGSAATVAVENGNIVAHYGGIGMKFYHKGRFFKVFQPCDVMTHPKYRARIFSRRGAMIRAGEHFYATCPMDFAFGFPSERHAVLGTKQLGYTEHDYVTVLSKKVKKVSLFKSAGNLFLQTIEGWGSVHETELDSLWNEVRDDYGLTIDKNSRYIFWRYKNHPSNQNEPLLVRSRYGKAPKAFVVFTVKGSELVVLDFFCLKGVDIKILLKLIEKAAIQRCLSVVKVWVNPNEGVFRSLVDYGYTEEKGIPYMFKIINGEITRSFLFNKYCYRMGDYDAA